MSVRSFVRPSSAVCLITCRINSNYPRDRESSSRLILTREEFGLANRENAVVPGPRLHPGAIVLRAPINSAPRE